MDLFLNCKSLQILCIGFNQYVYSHMIVYIIILKKGVSCTGSTVMYPRQILLVLDLTICSVLGRWKQQSAMEPYILKIINLRCNPSRLLLVRGP
jgi:hypothetical protein